MKKKINIVLVDDEEALCKAVGKMLTQEGYTVTTFGSAEECLTNFSPGTTDLLITDLRLLKPLIFQMKTFQNQSNLRILTIIKTLLKKWL